jgi:ASC-1-like (ASCH) protein
MVKSHLVTIGSKESIINIINGYKKVELRVFTPVYNNISVNNYIRFVHTDRVTSEQYICDVTVDFVNVYDNFKKLIEVEGLDTTIPQVKNIDEGLKKLTYKEEEEEYYGVIAIGFKIIKNN